MKIRKLALRVVISKVKLPVNWRNHVCPLHWDGVLHGESCEKMKKKKRSLHFKYLLVEKVELHSFISCNKSFSKSLAVVVKAQAEFVLKDLTEGVM